MQGKQVIVTGHKAGGSAADRQFQKLIVLRIAARMDHFGYLNYRRFAHEHRQELLALFARDYKEDDLEGEAHTQTSIAATRELERDVRDFLRRAEMEGWK